MSSRTPEGSVDEVGFGRTAERGRTERLLNPDGSFNVDRRGISALQSLTLYHFLLTTTWPRFFGILIIAYLVTNIFFGGCFFLLGPEQLEGLHASTWQSRLIGNFFFSVQTLATIGYGAIHPKSVAANTLVAIEALVGLLQFTLMTGLFFARVSRPQAKIRFSERAVVAPFQGKQSLQFRMVNLHRSQLLEAEVRMVVALLEQHEGKEVRRYYRVNLFIDHIIFFSTYWTVTHIIDDTSPLFGMSQDDFVRSKGEVLILFKAVDETFSQTVHARTSYRYDEVLFSGRFATMYVDDTPGRTAIDVNRLSTVENL